MSKADKLLKRVEFYEKMASTTKPETSDLLNKVSLFERLALYSDRKSFLSAIAQSPADVQQTEAEIRNVVSSLVSSIENWIATKSERQAYLPGNLPGLPQTMANAANTMKRANSLSGKFDVSALPGLLSAARTLAAIPNLGNTSDDGKKAWLSSVFPHASQLISLVSKQMKDLAAFQAEYGPEESPENVGETIELDNIPSATNTAPGGQKLPSINPADQQAVFQFAIQQGQLAPNPQKQKADGTLGPETRKALEGIKNYFARVNPNNPRMTDQQAINAAKFQGR